MKMAFEPTLSEIREMLGEDLYVKFVWMWREQEQDRVAAERRAKLAASVPARKVETWPTPIFARVEEAERAPEPVASAAQAFQAALLRPARNEDSIEVGELAGFLDRVGAREDTREVAMGGRRRRR